MASGLYIAHASVNLFGPRPKTGSFLRTDLATCAVETKDGLTSAFRRPRLLGKIPPMNCPDMKNKRVTIIIVKEKVGKCPLLPAPYRACSGSGSSSTESPAPEDTL